MLNANEKQLNNKMEYYQKLFGIVAENTVTDDDYESSITLTHKDIVSSGEYHYEQRL